MESFGYLLSKHDIALWRCLGCFLLSESSNHSLFCWRARLLGFLAFISNVSVIILSSTHVPCILTCECLSR